MDISDISKVASRKRMNEDVGKLKEKISREAAKIIKLKVAQDTAYWDLKEKLSQTERNHELLQQNMVDVQMQLEATSAQYQHELRARPDTLNKVQCTREICDVLQAYTQRLQRGVARCRGDQAVLHDAYNAAARTVRDHSALASQQRLRATLEARHHRDALRAATQRYEEAAEYATTARRDAEAARDELTAIRARADQLGAERADLKAQIQAAAQQLQKREEALSNLQEDARRLISEYEARCDRMQNNIATQERKINEAVEANESLKTALRNQEEFSESIRSQNNQLQEQIALAEEQAAAKDGTIEALQTELQDTKRSVDNLKKDLETTMQYKKLNEEVIEDKNQQLENFVTEVKSLKENLAKLEEEKCALQKDLETIQKQSNNKSIRIEEMSHVALALEEKIHKDEMAFKNQLETDKQVICELESTVATRDREIKEKIDTISKLMAEVRQESEAFAKAEGTIATLRRQFDAERDAASARIAEKDAALAAKENELGKQMTMILELRAEKERLQEKIRGMQNKIDNIQKELTGRDPPPRESGERPHEAAAARPAKGQVSQPELPFDSLLYNFMSDDSVSGILDAPDMDRRFEELCRANASPQQPQVLSLSKLRNNQMVKNQKFFKNKRSDNKQRKQK